MSQPISFTKTKDIPDALGRAGIIHTQHGDIETPAFVTVGTKATVKSLTPEQVKDLGAQVVLANTYHLYLEPGDEIVKEAGGLHAFMNWKGPTITDSGGFQVFSLGEALGKGVSKVATGEAVTDAGDVARTDEFTNKRAKIDEEGVTFVSHKDGKKHRMTPEDSMRIQHNIGADIMFAFDECTSPHAKKEYQKEAMERTHRWAERCIAYHKESGQDKTQGLFAVVQGGRFEELRKESAKVLSEMDFAGFGVGGSFVKEDMDTAVGWVNEILPADKPRHLLGIGEPLDILKGVEQGCDTFDCVAATRMARNGGVYIDGGKINLLNAQFKKDFTPIMDTCDCYTCAHYTRAYIAHLFRAKEMLAATLASIHNLRFIIRFTDEIRESIKEGTFTEHKKEILQKYGLL
ncbi:MAG: tRNA guanosine(34) transglycosylase Tgt [Candidatus Zambryskibacteria bacterium CG10_big_fil_rev_8_21_14_0_10_42_12]|uniref:Queuine tRNA-ribosyltransferase n=1 Tax=Candidatus Zambryskibacteria bacterium CG10_big_fil_rev_8_21_14_0_10_42_12 TaxID=1975115 RepID=A0A2H0QWH8_9BACT|nr:MAG: tRNA guanosine(34) transglycosylase Tgt [Candidatus Zambryskibacteria bacterium CG10_big_fil_rev_8_21_14_0_10_42_12]